MNKGARPPLGTGLCPVLDERQGCASPWGREVRLAGGYTPTPEGRKLDEQGAMPPLWTRLGPGLDEREGCASPWGPEVR